MQPEPTSENPFPRPTGPWGDDIKLAEKSPYAYRPGEIVVMGAEDAARALDVLEAGAPKLNETPVTANGRLISVTTELDIEKATGELGRLGIRAEPNYAFFAHGASSCGGCGCALCGCGTTANPFAANPFAANPFAANPFAANPFAANPFAANAVMANPFAANPFAANPFAANPFAANPFAANVASSSSVRRTSARPSDPPDEASRISLPDHAAAHVIIYDTGVSIKEHFPATLQNQQPLMEAADLDRDKPDESGDRLLDPVAGHGSFIAGVIDQFAPNQHIRVSSVLSTFGHGFATTIAHRITKDVDALSKDEASRTVLNMSFGSYADQEMYLIADAVAHAQAKGCVVVASAGNDGTYLPTFPATLPGVISVASIDECGRAPYSNYGPWVRACAPGSDVVSAFFHSINGDQQPTPNSPQVDPEGFNGGASWSGTSFAAPVVVAAILRQMAGHDQSAAEAADIVINAPGLLRLPGLGTVVNLAAGM